MAEETHNSRCDDRITLTVKNALEPFMVQVLNLLKERDEKAEHHRKERDDNMLAQFRRDTEITVGKFIDKSDARAGEKDTQMFEKTFGFPITDSDKLKKFRKMLDYLELIFDRSVKWVDRIKDSIIYGLLWSILIGVILIATNLNSILQTPVIKELIYNYKVLH